MCQPPALADDAHRGELLLRKAPDAAISWALSGERAQSVHRLPCPRPREIAASMPSSNVASEPSHHSGPVCPSAITSSTASS
jgi:hypothetical protein